MNQPTKHEPTANLLALVLGVIGAALLIAGWVGASGRAAIEGQVGFVSLGVSGLAVAGAGAGIHLASLRRRLTLRCARFENAVTAWMDRSS